MRNKGLVSAEVVKTVGKDDDSFFLLLCPTSSLIWGSVTLGPRSRHC